MSRDVRQLLHDAVADTQGVPDLAAIKRRGRRLRRAHLAAAVASVVAIGSASTLAAVEWLDNDRELAPTEPVAPEPCPMVDESPVDGPGVTETVGWERVPDSENVNVEVGITAADGTVVALGGLQVWVSSDGGSQWSRLDDSAVDHGALGDEYFVFWHDIAVAGDGTLVAVGSAANPRADIPLALVSMDDGRSWSVVVVDGVDGFGYVAAVDWSDEGFVAVGAAGAATTGWHSEDGTSWSRLDLPRKGAPAGFADVVIGPAGQKVAIMATGDGSIALTWQAVDASDVQTHELPTGVGSVAATQSRIYATAGHGALLESPDGCEWDVDPRSEALEDREDITVFIDSPVYVDSVGRLVLAGSSDRSGAVWIAETPASPLERVGGAIFDEVFSVLYIFEGPNGLIAVSSSDDGVIWQEVRK